MFLAEIGTPGVICAYFFWHITSAYSLNVSDPIEGQPVQLSYYLFVFGCGLVFWLLVLLWPRYDYSGHRHSPGYRQANICKVAKEILISSTTTLILWGCLRAPFMKLPLLVRFLVPFQVSSNLALLLLWAFLRSVAHACSSTEPVILRGGAGTITEHAFNSSKIAEMSLILAAQTTGTLIGFHSIPIPSSSSKALLDVALMAQLVAYLCGRTSILLSSPENSNIFANIGIVCTVLGFILMVAMFVPWYLVLITVLLFGVVLLIFFWEELKFR